MLFAKDIDAKVRFAVAINKNTSLEALKFLLNDEDDDVFDAANNN